MNAEIIKLNFLSGLHIGKGFDDLAKSATIYNSDALKSALFALGISYYPEWKNDSSVFFDSFSISNSFPYCDNDLFMPKPDGMIFDFIQKDELTEAKKAKKITFVSSDIFSDWVNNPDVKIKVDENNIANSTFLFHRSTARKFMYTSIQQRVVVHNEQDEETKPFYFERLFFNKKSGLYFIIQFHNDDIKPKILHVLRLLGEAGIGSDRGVGNGQFTIDEPISFVLPNANKKGVQMNLGLYLPTRDELQQCNLNESTWSLVRRGGFMAASENLLFRSLRKNSIYFFTEGSMFKATIPLKGRLVNLQPQWNDTEMHPVWRCGKPLFINL